MLCAASVDVTMRSLWIQPTTTTTVNDVIMIIQHWWEIILVWSYNIIMIIIIVQYLASIQNVCWKRCCFVYLVVDVFFFRFVSTDVEQCITTGFFSYSSYIIYIFFLASTIYRLLLLFWSTMVKKNLTCCLAWSDVTGPPANTCFTPSFLPNAIWPNQNSRISRWIFNIWYPERKKKLCMEKTQKYWSTISHLRLIIFLPFSQHSMSVCVCVWESESQCK